MREINMLVIHCSWTKATQMIGVAEIRRWHKEQNGWKDIGYNEVIRRNGMLEMGRDIDGDGDYEEEIGAHAYGFNRNSIGICLIGGRGADGRDETNFTDAQYKMLKQRIEYYMFKYPGLRVVGHNELTSHKTCPTFNVQKWMQDNMYCGEA